MNYLPKETLKDKWVEALRSGKYAQSTGALRDEEDFGFCCLGVLCEVAGIQSERDPGNDEYFYHGENAELPKDLSAHMGMWDSSGTFDKRFGESPETCQRAGGLTDLNDDIGATFDQIADLIEARPDLIFTWATPATPPSIIQDTDSE